jgi:hypothetical protein
MLNDLETIREVFNKHNVNFYLVYGLVLGMHRDGKPLPGDEDVDIAVVDPIDLETRKKIGWMLYDLGFKPQPIAFNVFGRMEESEPGYNGDGESGIIVCEREFKFTIFFFGKVVCPQHGAEYLCVPKLGSVKLISIPAKFFDNPESIKVGKKKYLVPGPLEEYLAYSYYDNWKDKEDRRHSPLYPEQHA